MPETLLSFDPGGVHCGVAIWMQVPDPLTSGLRWKCREVWEADSPEQFIDDVCDRVTNRLIDRVVGEGFFLQADKALAQIGSPFETVEVIGAIRTICRWQHTPFELVRPLDRQHTWVKMKAVKYKFPKGIGGHATSAVCVGAVATDWLAINHYEGDGVG